MTSPIPSRRASSMKAPENVTSGVFRSDSATSQLSHRTRHLSYQSTPLYPPPQHDVEPRRSNSTPMPSRGSRTSESSPRSPRLRLLSNSLRWFTRSPPAHSTLPPSESPAPNLEPELQPSNSHDQDLSSPRFIEQFDSLPPPRISISSTAATPSFTQKRTEMDERLKEDMKLFKFQLEPILSEDNLRSQLFNENEGSRVVSGRGNDEDASSLTTPRIQVVQPTPQLPDYTPFDPRSPPQSPRGTSKLPKGGITRSSENGPTNTSLPSPPPTADEHSGFAYISHPHSTLPSSPATTDEHQSRGDMTLPQSPTSPSERASQLPSPPPSQPRLHRVRRYFGKRIQEVPKTQTHKIDLDGTRVNVPSVDSSPQRSIPVTPEVPALDTDLAEMGLGPAQHETFTSATTPLSPRKRPKRVPPPYLEISGTGSSSLPMNLKLQAPAFQGTDAGYDRPIVGNLSDAASSPRSTIRSGSTTPPAQALVIPGNPTPRRTLDVVRSQVAQEMALRVVSKSKVVDGVQVGIADASSASSPDDISFVHMVAANLASSFTLTSTPYLFIVTIATAFGGTPPSPIPGIVYITSSSNHITERAIQLSHSKFVGRIASSSYTFSSPDQNYLEGSNLGYATKEQEWMARINDLHVSSFDSDILHFIITSASRTPLDPCTAPPNSKSINTILAEAQARLQRVTPRQAYKEIRSNLMDVPTILVDIRSNAQRDEFGWIDGSLAVERNVLEWKFDPRSEMRLKIADRYDLRVIVFDQDGFTSSLAAVSLQKLGLLNATDMIGGFRAWKDSVLPVVTAQRYNHELGEPGVPVVRTVCGLDC